MTVLTYSLLALTVVFLIGTLAFQRSYGRLTCGKTPDRLDNLCCRLSGVSTQEWELARRAYKAGR